MVRDFRLVVTAIAVAVNFLVCFNGVSALAQETSSIPITSQQREALETWGNRLRDDLGTVLTPPVGRVDSDTRILQKLLEDMIEKLAGPLLRERGDNVIVNIYSSPVVNAFAYEQPSDMFLEQEWKEKREKEGLAEPWPIREFYGFKNDKPIIEFGFTAGLLKTLPNVDALAFVVAHELCHYLEKHTHHKKKYGGGIDFGKYWNSQSNETVADYCGIRKMLGKYNLMGALEALYAIKGLAETDDFDIGDAVSAGLGTHHSEGPRITAAQANIEYMMRNFIEARAPGVNPYPAAVQKVLNGKLGRIPKKVTDNYEAFKVSFSKALNEYFLLGKDHPWFAKEFIEREDPKFVRQFNYYMSLSEAHFNVALLDELNLIEKSEASGYQKVKAFLLMIMARHKESAYSVNDKFDNLPDSTKFEIINFLVKYTKGENGFSAQKFAEFGAEMQGENYKFVDDDKVFYADQVFNRNASLMGMVYKASLVNSDWKKVFESILDVQKYIFPDKIEFDKINNIIQLVYNYKSNPGLYKAAMAVLTPQLEGLNVDHLLADINEELELPSFNGLYEMVKFKSADYQGNPEEENYTENVKAHLSQREHYQVFAEIFSEAMAELEKRLVTDFIASVRSGDESRGLQKSRWEIALEVFKNIDPQELPNNREYQQVLQAAADMFLKFKDEFDSEPFGLSAYASEAEILMLSYMVVDSRFSLDQRIYFYQALVALQFAERKGKENEAIKSNIAKFFSDLPEAEFNELAVRSFPPTHELVQYWAKISQPINDGRLGTDVLRNSQEVMDKFREETKKLGEYGTIVPQQMAELQLNILSRTLRDIQRADRKLSIVNFEQYLEFLKSVNKIKVDYVKVKSITIFTPEYDDNVISTEAMEFLVDTFVEFMDQTSGPEQFMLAIDYLDNLGNLSFNLTAQQKMSISSHLYKHLSSMSVSQSRSWLKRQSIRKLLTKTDLLNLLVSQVTKTVSNRNIDYLAKQVNFAIESLKLRDELPEVFAAFRNSIAEIYNIQPHEVKKVFGIDTRTDTEKIMNLANEIRGASALSETIRGQSIDDQLTMIEYLMGREREMPAFVFDLERKLKQQTQGKLSLVNLVTEIAGEMKVRTTFERSFLVNTILAGPNGLLKKEGARKIIVDRLLSLFTEEDRGFAEVVARAMFKAEGEQISLLLSFILGQNTEQDDGSVTKLTKTEVFKAMLEMRGVPGIKFGQYLAFTNEFSQYEEAFEDFQDAAMPLNYYEVLDLILERFGDEWSSRHAIRKIIGSGSVNIAVLYEDLDTGETRVLNIARSNIIARTKEDFRRFHEFLKELVAEDDSDQFQFALGLLTLIEKSVALEFDKNASMNMQNNAYDLYGGQIRRGWSINSIRAFEERNMSIFMELAEGTPAKKMLNEDPQTYKEAMAALLEVIFDNLMGKDMLSDGGIFMANPDLHDGQVFIDKETKRVTVIDFGQAVPMSENDRLFALDILRMIGSDVDFEDVNDILTEWAKRYGVEFSSFEERHYNNVFKSKERMDRFIKLISRMNLNGFEVPTAVVNWIFSANRVIVLGQKVKHPMLNRFKIAVGADAIGGDIGFMIYRETSEAIDSIKRATSEFLGDVSEGIESVVDGVADFFGFGDDEEKEAKPILREQPQPEKMSCEKALKYRG